MLLFFTLIRKETIKGRIWCSIYINAKMCLLKLLLTCLLFSPHRFKNLEILYEINHIKYYEDWMYSRRFLLLWWALRLLDVVYRVKYSFRNAFYTHVFQTSYLNLLNSCLIKLDLKLYLEVVFLIWRKYNFLRFALTLYF